MDQVILILCVSGICLLWERASPIQPVRHWLTIHLNRWWEWMVVGRNEFHRFIALPLWWAKGILGCGECKIPYLGFGIGLLTHHGWRTSLIIGLAAYAVYVMFFVEKKHDQ
jgi:hypothetical protein